MVKKIIKTQKELKKLVEELVDGINDDCICTDWDGKGKSPCGFDCPVHSKSALSQLLRKYRLAFTKSYGVGACKKDTPEAAWWWLSRVKGIRWLCEYHIKKAYKQGVKDGNNSK